MKKYLVLVHFMLLVLPCYAEINIAETQGFTFSLTPYLRIDGVSMRNTVDLDSHNRDDHSTYMGIDYSLGFGLNFKDEGPKFFVKLERNGPWDYDAPLFIHNTLTVSGPSRIEVYRNDELLPQFEEFWFDVPLGKIPLRFKAGLFAYDIGKGFAMGTGTYENYGLMLYHQADNFGWRFHYFRPDVVYKNHLGPRIRQDEDEGIRYEPNAANYFTLDANFAINENKFQPFLGLLIDRTSAGKRSNLFTAPVQKEMLGIAGLDYDVTIKELSLGLEIARNFGRGESTQGEFKDVEHKGYLLYTNASYGLGKFVPHASFLFSSGNKVTTDMVDNGDTTFTSGANNAFSIYSPLNINLFDCLSPSTDTVPLVFFGWGYGLSYGMAINRPSTLSDDTVLENLIMPSVGFDYNFTEKFSANLDWWYIKSNERGVGTLSGRAKELSKYLGQEVDLTFSYDISKNFNVSLYTGWFFPGKFFREERDDTGGSLFTPFVRGDGNANSAYQIELIFEMEF